MAIEITTYQIPAAGQDPKVYIQELNNLKDQASDFSRSLGRVSWFQGHILLLAREQCKKKGDWQDFLASVGMSKSQAYQLRRIATDIVADKKDLEFTEMLAIIFPNSYGKHLRDSAENETFETQGITPRKTGNNKVKTQTIEKATTRLGTLKKSIQEIADRKLVDCKLPPKQAEQQYDLAIGAIDVCREELGKLSKKLKIRKKALTATPMRKVA